MDRGKKGFTPAIGYPNQTLGYVSNEHPSYMQSSNQNLVGSKDIQIEGLMTFKQFTLNQDDSLSPSELLEMYDAYKTKYIQRHQLEFLENNRSSPFILEKFHPIWIKRLIEERKSLVLKRIELFINKLVNNEFNSIRRSISNFESSNGNSTSALFERRFDEMSNSEQPTTIFGGPYYEIDLRSHILLMTDIPIYISHLDILNFLNNDFPLLEGGLGKCDGFLDISLSLPKFTRGILNRQCYILFDNTKNRDSAIEMMKGKTIKSSFTTQSIIKSYLTSINQEEEQRDQFDSTLQHSGGKYSIYIIQTRVFNENNLTRFGNLPKIFSTNEQLTSDKNNMLKIIEKIEREQEIHFKIKEELDNMVTNECLDTKFVVDILCLYLRFVHGVDYYSFSSSNLFQSFPRDEPQVFSSESSMENVESKGFDLNEFGRSAEGSNISSRFSSRLAINQQNMLFLSRGYIDTVFKNKFRGGWLRDESTPSDSLIYEDLIENHQNQIVLRQLEENIRMLLSLPSIFSLIPEPILDTDDALSSAWKRYCEQHTLRKKADRWQCGKCLKQFKGEEFVHKHLAKKHGDFIEAIKEDITFERIIRPLSEKFPQLIYPTSIDELGIGTSHKRVYSHMNTSGPFKSRHRHQRSVPYDKRRHFRDWDTPKQNSNNTQYSNVSGDIRMSIKYDDL